MIKVVIADDHPVVRKGIKGILSEDPYIEVVGEAKNGDETLDILSRTKCDLLIMDMSMPDKSGLELLKEVQQFNLQLPVLILSMHPEEQYAVRVLKAGAAGYISKDSSPENLLKAIKKAASGGKYITPSLAEKLACNLAAKDNTALHETLSDREFQIMCLIASGKSPTEIAEKLCLSIKTISTYRSRIMQKMNMKTNAEIIHYAVKNHILV